MPQVDLGSGKGRILFISWQSFPIKSDFQLTLLEPARFSLVGMTVSGFGESTPPARDFTNFYQQDAEDGVELMKILGFSKSRY